MAKEQNQRPNFNNTSKVDTDLFVKGMIKDSHESFVGQENWVNARNAINNSVSGDAGTIGNEPANLSCANVLYTIIGAVYLFGDKWIIYSTDNNTSEIGLFDDSQCEYDVLVNDTCLNFNKFNLITGASKENYDCTWQIYWDDGLNPSRTLNIGPKDKITENLHIPWIQEQVEGTGTEDEPCVEYVDVLPLKLNCDLIRLAPFMKTPKLSLEKADSPGQLKNGSYQVYIAYTINEQQIGDYIGVSNIQPLFDGDDTASSLDIFIDDLDKNFEFYKVVLLMNNQQQTQAIQLGLYSTEQSKINIDYINPNTASASQVPISTLPLRTPVYERSDQMVVLNDYLMRVGPTTQFDFNYQPLANEITARWVSVEYPATYYKNGGNKPSFMRDEQYTFFIRFIYKTGDKSTSYHIPGRAYLTDNQIFGNEKGGADNNNALNTDEQELWQTTNTAFVDEIDGTTVTEDGGVILSKGQMGYWESSEKYPSEDPHGRWGELCGQNIRHHKFPEEQTDIDTLNRSSANNQNIRILSVEFDNIVWPVDNDGVRIPNITGYEILVGSRQGNKSILAKGIIRNMRSYQIPAGGNFGADIDPASNIVGLMPNYPFNSWNADPYLTTQAPDGTAPTISNDHDSFPHICGNTGAFHGTCTNFYTFHSPETSFNRPYLNPAEVKSYGLTQGFQQGHFTTSEEHPKNVLIRDFAAIIAVLVGCAYAIGKMRGKRTTELHSNTSVLPGGITAGTALMIPTETALTLSTINPVLGPGLGEEAYMGTTAAIWEAEGALNNIGIPPAAGQLGAKRVMEFEGTDWKAGPNAIYGVLSLFGFLNYVVDGGQVIIDLIYNAAGVNQHAYKYNSYGLYSQTEARHDGDVYRGRIEKARYVGNVIQDFGSTGIGFSARVNNLFRPSTVVLQSLGNQGGAMLSGIPSDNSKVTLGVAGQAALDNPTRGNWTSQIGAHYVGLKFAMDNQYGQLDGIKQIPISKPQNWLDEFGHEVTNLTVEDNQIFKSEPLFGGDVYINRYNEKVIMPFFWQFLKGEPDEFGFQYQNYMNVPYTKFYMDTTKYDLINMIAPIADFSFSWTNGGLPSTMHNMDRDASQIETGGTISGYGQWSTSGYLGGTNNNFFVLKRAYMYTHNSGVNDFFVESELNVGLREQGGNQKEKFYDWTEYTDLNSLFHSDIIKDGNFYKYDFSLSKYNLTSQMITHGAIQTRDYDPFVAETCYDYYPKRILYSNQAFKEAKKDFWRVYLPNNYQDFKNAPTTIKPISKSGALILFPHLAPISFQGVDTLTTDYNTKLVIGDGGLFNDPMQQISTADLPHEYGSCENSRSVINTPSGVFYMSQAQGKIFQYGQTLQNIADAGMKQWFNNYLPSRLLAAFPEIEGTSFADNPIMGVACQSVYDPNYDIVYFCKKDYEPCNVDECIQFDPEIPGFINPCENPPTPECPEDYNLECQGQGDNEFCECCPECPEGTFASVDGRECCEWVTTDPEYELPREGVNPIVGDATSLYLNNPGFEQPCGVYWCESPELNPDTQYYNPVLDINNPAYDQEDYENWFNGAYWNQNNPPPMNELRGSVPDEWIGCMTDMCPAEGEIGWTSPQTTDILDGTTFYSVSRTCCGLMPHTGNTYLGLFFQENGDANGYWREGATQLLKDEDGNESPFVAGNTYVGEVVLAADGTFNRHPGQGNPYLTLSDDNPFFELFDENGNAHCQRGGFPGTAILPASSSNDSYQAQYCVDCGLPGQPYVNNRPELQIYGSMDPCMSESGAWCDAFAWVDDSEMGDNGGMVNGQQYIGDPEDAELLWRSGDISNGGTDYHHLTGWKEYAYTLNPTRPWKYFTFIINSLPGDIYFNSLGVSLDRPPVNAYLCLDSLTPPRIEDPGGYCRCDEVTEDGVPYTLVFDDGIYETPASEDDCLNYLVTGEGLPTTCVAQACEPIECIEPTLIQTPIDITDSPYFNDISWTVSYDPKIKGWISFHDWHPELTMSSHKHFLTTNTVPLLEPHCPLGWELDEITGLCTQDCPEGYYLEDGMCLPSGCPEGSFWNETQTQCCSYEYGELVENLDANGNPIPGPNDVISGNTSVADELGITNPMLNGPNGDGNSPTGWNIGAINSGGELQYWKGTSAPMTWGGQEVYADGPTSFSQLEIDGTMYTIPENIIWGGPSGVFTADLNPSIVYGGLYSLDEDNPNRYIGMYHNIGYCGTCCQSGKRNVNNRDTTESFQAYMDYFDTLEDDYIGSEFDNGAGFAGSIANKDWALNPNGQKGISSFCYREAQWQKLPQPMVVGQTYNSTIAAAAPKRTSNTSYDRLGPKTCWPAQVEIWGSDSPPGCYRSFAEIAAQEAEEEALGEEGYGAPGMCSTGYGSCNCSWGGPMVNLYYKDMDGNPDPHSQLLWASPDVTDRGEGPGTHCVCNYNLTDCTQEERDASNWNVYDVSFTPTKPWRYITFRANGWSSTFRPKYTYDNLLNNDDPDCMGCMFDNFGPYDLAEGEYNNFNDIGFFGLGEGDAAYVLVDNFLLDAPEPPVIPTNCSCEEGFEMVYAGSTTPVPESEQPILCVDEGNTVECVKLICEDILPIPNEPLEPSFESSGLWKHNVRCDLFNNYYDIQYPWEIEIIESVGQEVNTIRSIEYQLESYLYRAKYDEEGCIINSACEDRWHDLKYNFDEAIVYNSEQNSGLLTLIQQNTNVNDIVQYPIIGEADIQILYTKVEQKYRFDQFWDNTRNRNNAFQSMFITQLNGYIKDLNAAYLDYDKPQLERKKFRHYVNNLILRKKVIYEETNLDAITVYPDGKPHTRKMLLKLVNTKINLSHR